MVPIIAGYSITYTLNFSFICNIIGMSFVLCQKTSKSWQLQVDGTLIEPKCEVSHGNFRDWPHVFYIYKQVSKFCDCIKIYIFHFGCFWGTYPKCILLMLTYFADNGFWNSCNPIHSIFVTHFGSQILKYPKWSDFKK